MGSVEAVQVAQADDARRRAYAKLVSCYHARVYGHLYLMCRDEQLAADLTAETFATLWERPPRSRREASRRAYVFTVAVNALKQHLRRRGVDWLPLNDAVPLAAPGDDPLDTLSREQLGSAVRDAVARLPEIYRVVVLLHNLEGFKVREVSEILDIPIGTVKSRLHAGFAMLRRSLREWRDE